MALSKAKKIQIVDEIKQHFSESKMTVFANYRGTPVKALQTLRKMAKKEGSTLKVIKNRLVLQAIKSGDLNVELEQLKLNDMLLYGFSASDEVAAVKVIAEFAKQQPSISFVGAIDETGTILSADKVKALAALPSKQQLLANIIYILQGPSNNLIGSLNGGLANIVRSLQNQTNN